MALNPGITDAILAARTSIHTDSIFMQHDFNDMAVSVQVFRPKHPNVREGRRSVIKVTIDTQREKTAVEEVKEFCKQTPGLRVADSEESSTTTSISIVLN